MKTYRWFAEQVLRFRWGFMALLGALMFLYEITQYGENQNFEFELVFESLVLGVVLPLLGGYLLGKLAYFRTNSGRHKSLLGEYKSLFHELAQRRELDELMKFLVQYPGTVFPVEQASLYVYDHHLARLELAASWNIHSGDDTLQLTSASRICQTCLASYQTPIHPANPYQCPFVTHPPGNEFCLTLSYSKVLIGTLRLACQNGRKLTSKQIDFLNSSAPEIALALAIAIANPRQMAHVRMQTQFMERQQTAIELHNALAQQVGFLHLSLDRIAGDEKLEMSDQVRGELARIRLTASEAYEQVRNMLTLLLSWESVDLTQAIVDHSFKAAQRSHLANSFSTTGSPVTLPAGLRRQIFNLFQESLNNIEKHAFAQHIHIRLVWTADCLTMHVQDDGIGFQLASVQGYGHYGLTMMRELVKTVDGDLEIESSDGQGTCLTFKIPLLVTRTSSSTGRSRSVQSYALSDPPVQVE